MPTKPAGLVFQSVEGKVGLSLVLVGFFTPRRRWSSCWQPAAATRCRRRNISAPCRGVFWWWTASRRIRPSTRSRRGLIVLAFCWAHQRRDFLELARSWPEQQRGVGLGVQRIGAFYHLNDRRLELREDSEGFEQAPIRICV